MKDSIKALREKHNYSQSYLATYLQVSRQMYIKYESGEVEPPVKVVVALAKLYSVSYSQIIDDEFSPNKEKVSYKIHQDSESEVASPIVSYGFSSKKPKTQLALVTTALENLSEEALISVSAFVKMLQAEQIIPKQPSSKSKKAFFDLAGKISLDSDSVTEFREASLI
jgi:transcriptional regulator with XRE-family HTH domain